MRKAALLILLVGALPALCFAAAVQKPSPPAAKISKGDATKTALAKTAGKIQSAELETENGILVYSFDILSKTGIHEVQVDAHTGVVVSDRIESAADEAREKAAEKAAKKGTAEKKR